MSLHLQPPVLECGQRPPIGEFPMSLIEIELACRSANLSIQRNEEGIVVTLPGSGNVSYPALISEREDKGIQAFVWFPQAQHHTIEKAEELCSTMKAYLKPYAQVGFHPEKSKFWAGCFLDDEQILRKLSAFAQACDILHPLVERVGCLGYWDRGLVKLACTMPEECAGRC